MENKEVDLYLFGIIGEDFNGNDLAHQITDLGEYYDTVHLHINSVGGSVEQGLSVVSAILSARAFMHIHIEGIAASMAAVIALCGDKVEMQDYAKLMIHDPFYEEKSDKLTDKEQKCINSIKDTLQTILSRRGVDKEAIGEMMTNETWLSADDAKTAGLIDEVVTTQRKELQSLSATELMAKIMNTYINVNSNEMKVVAAKLGLPEAATEADVLNKVNALQNELQTVTAERDGLKTKISGIEAAQQAAQVQEAETLINAAVKDGRVGVSGKEAMTAVFAVDFEKGKALLNALPKSQSVAGQIQTSKSKMDVFAKMTWDELDKAGKLQALKEADGNLYAEKYEQKFGVRPTA